MIDYWKVIEYALIESIERAQRFDGTSLALPNFIEGRKAALTFVQEIQQEVQLDWSKAQTWAQWWAVDPNGWASWYQEEPVLHVTVSYSGWRAKTIKGVEQGDSLWDRELDIPLGVDWRTLKQRRPQAQDSNTAPTTQEAEGNDNHRATVDGVWQRFVKYRAIFMIIN